MPVNRNNIEQRIFEPDDSSLGPTDTCSDFSDDGWVSEEIRAVDLACSRSSISINSHELVPSPMPYEYSFVDPSKTKASSVRNKRQREERSKPQHQPSAQTTNNNKWRERTGVYTFESVRNNRSKS